MAAPMGKRALEQVDDEVAKKAKLSDNASKLDTFLSWCKDGHLELSDKVRVGREGSCAQYGMVAAEDIAEGEVLFTIPRTLILTPETSAVAQLIEEEEENLRSESGWVPLLVTLLHEYTSPTSQWRSYLDLVPDFSELDLPMFWPRDTVEKELKGTEVDKAVFTDLKNIEREFNDVVAPFLKSYPLHFPPECNDLELYKKMVAFVLAYSFTEPPNEDEEEEEEEDEPQKPPMMVPMADILNHVAQNNAQLDFGEAELKMVATKPIAKGEEVYNTYGELSNKLLMHMYGFTEQYPKNCYDTVEIGHKIVERTMLASQPLHTEAQRELFAQKWSYLTNADVVDRERGVLVVGMEGILNEPECIKLLQVLHMTKDEFDALKEKMEEGWESEDEEDVGSLAYEDFGKLPEFWLISLASFAREWLKEYGSDVEQEEEKLAEENWSKLSSRHRFCVHLRLGQMKLLQRLMDQCNAIGRENGEENGEEDGDEPWV